MIGYISAKLQQALNTLLQYVQKVNTVLRLDTTVAILQQQLAETQRTTKQALHLYHPSNIISAFRTQFTDKNATQMS